MAQRTLRIRQESSDVLIIADGRTVATMGWQDALRVSRAIQVQAKKAEEIAVAEQIIFDQAILTRAGAPIGLTRNSDLLKEAAKEAAWNSKLRKYMPGGVKSKEMVGPPTIVQHQPKEERDNGKEQVRGDDGRAVGGGEL